MRNLSLHKETHLVARVGWLRAAVLGANDGLISTASLIMGVAAASASKGDIVIAGVAGLFAGALSMAAGEYVSVSSQADTETADIERETKELKDNPEFELNELTDIYVKRGLDEDLARKVAEQLSKKDPLVAHARDELGITDFSKANAVQAAFTSAITFTVGAALPLLMVIISPLDMITTTVSVTSLFFLSVLGAVGAKAGKANILKATIRVTFWGAFAMAVTAIIGKLFGAVV